METPALMSSLAWAGAPDPAIQDPRQQLSVSISVSKRGRFPDAAIAAPKTSVVLGEELQERPGSILEPRLDKAAHVSMRRGAAHLQQLV